MIQFDLKTGKYVRKLLDLGIGGKDGIYGMVYAPSVQRYYVSSGSYLYEADVNGNVLASYNSPDLKKAYGIALAPTDPGLSNRQEQVADQQQPAPNNSALRPVASPAQQPMTMLMAVPGKVVITGKPGEQYRLLATTDFVTWRDIAALQNTNGTVGVQRPRRGRLGSLLLSH